MLKILFHLIIIAILVFIAYMIYIMTYERHEHFNRVEAKLDITTEKIQEINVALQKLELID